MKRIFTLMIICILSAGMVFATDIESSSSQATYGLFLNELDAASTVNETSKGPGFTDLENDYLFAGISANIEKLNDNQSSNTATLGYYRAAAMPWSVFVNFDFSNADYNATETKSETTYPDPATSEKETLEAEVPGYNIINTDLQFLMNFGVASSGLKVDLRLDNNMDPANNYDATSTVVGSERTMSETDKGGSILGMTFTVPFFMETGDMKHYAEVSYGFDTTDNSTTLDAKAADGSYTQSDSTTDKSTDSLFAASYNLTLPLMGGELTPFVRIAKNGVKYTYDQSDSETIGGTTDSLKVERTREYDGGMEFKLGSAFLADLRPDDDWLKFRLQPWTFYEYKSTPYVKSTSSTIDNNGVVSESSTDGAMNHTYTHEIQLGLVSGAEMKPDNWFIGFQMGSAIVLDWERSITETKQASTTTAGVTVEGRDESKSINSTLWGSTVSMSYGFFVPLPDDYRLDFVLNSNDLFDFEDVTVQLIVPLN